MRILLPAVALASCFAPGVARADDWEAFHREDGITVWRRQVEGSSFVAFRGRGRVEAPIVQVAAVIRSAKRAAEWMHQCAEGEVIQYKTPITAFVYNRTESPVFFISDRDTVLENDVSMNAETKTMAITFHQADHELVPPRDGVVRMPKLEGHWKLTQIDVDTTEVEYQVEADPGGSLPAWLVNVVSKKLPYHTIQGLRRQARRGGYQQDRMILQVALDWTGFVLPQEHPTIGAAVTATVTGS